MVRRENEKSKGASMEQKVFYFHDVFNSLIVLIEQFLHDRFIRPFLGDSLATVWLYCLLRSFIDMPKVLCVLVALFLSFLVEFIQYFDLLRIFDLYDHKFLRIVLGATFDWNDLMAYSAGAVFLLMIFAVKTRLKNNV